MVDVLFVSELRPSLLEKTVRSFLKHVKCDDEMRALVHVDMVPKHECPKCQLHWVNKIFKDLWEGPFKVYVAWVPRGAAAALDYLTNKSGLRTMLVVPAGHIFTEDRWIES